jgi:hypothetical protein
MGPKKSNHKFKDSIYWEGAGHSNEDALITTTMAVDLFRGKVGEVDNLYHPRDSTCIRKDYHRCWRRGWIGECRYCLMIWIMLAILMSPSQKLTSKWGKKSLLLACQVKDSASLTNPKQRQCHHLNQKQSLKSINSINRITSNHTKYSLWVRYPLWRILSRLQISQKRKCLQSSKNLICPFKKVNKILCSGTSNQSNHNSPLIPNWSTSNKQVNTLPTLSPHKYAATRSC